MARTRLTMLILSIACFCGGVQYLGAPEHERPAVAASDLFRQQVGRIVAAIRRAAQENQRRPVDSMLDDQRASRIEGDALADFYIRRAAQAALAEHKGEPARAMVVALGVALDRTERFARHPAVRLLLSELETPAQRQALRDTVGLPTIRGRHDWFLHFVVSAALTGLISADAAEAAGLQKELDDARSKEDGRGSGFSFGDLAANYSGIELADVLLSDAQRMRSRLQILAAAFRAEDFVPDLTDGEEWLTYSMLVEQYGEPAENGFLKVTRERRQQVRELPGWRRLQAAGAP